jgi:hypothetical protein
MALFVNLTNGVLKGNTANRPFQGLFRHIAGGAKHWGERVAKPWLPYILLMSER